MHIIKTVILGMLLFLRNPFSLNAYQLVNDFVSPMGGSSSSSSVTIASCNMLQYEKSSM